VSAGGLAGFLAFGVAGFFVDAGLVDADFAATGLAGFAGLGLMLTGAPARAARAWRPCRP
jgi:hypothetical protein